MASFKSYTFLTQRPSGCQHGDRYIMYFGIIDRQRKKKSKREHLAHTLGSGDSGKYHKRADQR